MSYEILSISLYCRPGSTASDIEFECEMEGSSGKSAPIVSNSRQTATLKSMLSHGDLIPGVSTLKIDHHALVSANGNALFLEPEFDVKSTVVKRHHGKGPSSDSRRRLAIVKGDKPILAVKVFDSKGLARAETPQQMSYDIFGTGSPPYSFANDTVNLASQLYDCSMQELTLVPGDASTHNEAPGVISVNIPIDITNSTEAGSRYDVRNAITTAVQAKLGFSLPGPYQQVMYILEKCYHDCGWAAYAYINSWNSVYQGGYYYQVGVQVHELGHNFNLAHSGGLNGATYTDHTGLMGNPLYSDEVGKM